MESEILKEIQKRRDIYIEVNDKGHLTIDVFENGEIGTPTQSLNISPEAQGVIVDQVNKVGEAIKKWGPVVIPALKPLMSLMFGGSKK